MVHLSASAPPALHEYYRILAAGIEAYGDGSALRPLLSEHLLFDGSLAGRLEDAREGFLQGVRGFISTVQGMDLLREVHAEGSSAVLYDAQMPGGAVRFAEFFLFEDGVITSLHLHYDGPAYLAKGGQ